MSNAVQLYVYDLSNGIARQLSLQLTGRQIDGVWHTSVVVFSKEIFYGQGIIITHPGQSHHGSPLRVIDMGETGIDEETFQEYLATKRETYTAEKYHLLDFNCNSFTNDCLEFLTGGNIPAYIKSLPGDFLSTPFGQVLRPTIDAMFSTGRPPVYAPPRPAPASTIRPSSESSLPAGFLQTLSQTTIGAPAPTPPSKPAPTPDTSLMSSVHITTDPGSFQNLLRSHRAIVAFFTSATCGPCRMVEPVFEELARNKSRPSGGVGFAKIDLSVGMGSAVASQYQVRATPTFVFFLDGQKIHVLQGVDPPELRTQVDLLIYRAFPPHVHMSLSLPAVEEISLEPILFKQVPNLDSMFGKFAEFIGGATSWTGAVTQQQAIQTLFETVLPFLKTSSATPLPRPPNFHHWSDLTLSVSANLALGALFPLVDIWRLALLNPSFATWNTTRVSEGPIRCLVDKALEAKDLPRNYLLVVLRMLSNTFANDILAREVILLMRAGVTKLFVDALLHEDVLVRTAAASLAFNIAVYLQKRRVEKVKAGDGITNPEENEDWEVEILVAIVEGIKTEMKGEDTLHRLVACLALLVWLSPFMEQVTSLLEALQVGEALKKKLNYDGFGEGEVSTAGVRGAVRGQGIAKKEVRKLILEVAEKLCRT